MCAGTGHGFEAHVSLKEVCVSSREERGFTVETSN
jgi:hypothetical protein